MFSAFSFLRPRPQIQRHKLPFSWISEKQLLTVGKTCAANPTCCCLQKLLAKIFWTVFNCLSVFVFLLVPISSTDMVQSSGEAYCSGFDQVQSVWPSSFAGRTSLEKCRGRIRQVARDIKDPREVTSCHQLIGYRELYVHEPWTRRISNCHFILFFAVDTWSGLTLSTTSIEFGAKQRQNRADRCCRFSESTVSSRCSSHQSVTKAKCWLLLWMLQEFRISECIVRVKVEFARNTETKRTFFEFESCSLAVLFCCWDDLIFTKARWYPLIRSCEMNTGTKWIPVPSAWEILWHHFDFAIARMAMVVIVGNGIASNSNDRCNFTVLCCSLTINFSKFW